MNEERVEKAPCYLPIPKSLSWAPVADVTMEKQQEEEDDGLLAIGLYSDTELEAATNKKEEEARVPRDFQSEENFQKQLRDWRPGVEVGEVFSLFHFPFPFPRLPSLPVFKPLQEITKWG